MVPLIAILPEPKSAHTIKSLTGAIVARQGAAPVLVMHTNIDAHSHLGALLNKLACGGMSMLFTQKLIQLRNDWEYKKNNMSNIELMKSKVRGTIEKLYVLRGNIDRIRCFMILEYKKMTCVDAIFRTN